MPLKASEIARAFIEAGSKNISEEPFDPFTATDEELAEARFSGVRADDPAVDDAFLKEHIKEVRKRESKGE